MTRINKADKQLFVNKLTAKLFDKKIEDALNKAQSEKIGNQYYRIFISAAQEKKLRALDERFMPHTDTLRIQVFGTNFFLKLSEPKPKPSHVFNSVYCYANEIKRKHAKSDDIIFDGNSNYDFTEEEVEKVIAWAKKHAELFQKVIDLRKEKQKFEIDLRESIHSLASVKAIRRIDPALAKEWDEIMGEEGKEKHLPAILPTQVLNTIKSAQAEAQA